MDGTTAGAYDMAPNFVGLEVTWVYENMEIPGRVVSQRGNTLYTMADDGMIFIVPVAVARFLTPEAVHERVDSYQRNLLALAVYRDEALADKGLLDDGEYPEDVPELGAADDYLEEEDCEETAGEGGRIKLKSGFDRGGEGWN